MGQWLLQQSYDIGLKVPEAWQHDLWFLIMGGLIFLFTILPLILAIAYLTLWERKFLAWAHYRLGPNRAGPYGLLQPICDAIKLLVKENIRPLKADKYLWAIAPIITFVSMAVCFMLIPFSYGEITIRWPDVAFPQHFSKPMVAADVGVGIILILALSSLVVVGLSAAGFGSNNKYSLIGAIRSVGQIISYEVPIILSILTVVLVAGSMSMVHIVESQRYISSSTMQNYLEMDNIRARSPEGTFIETDNEVEPRVSDWAAAAAFFKEVPPYERGDDGPSAYRKWYEFREAFHEERAGWTISELTKDSLEGQKLRNAYMTYGVTKGSPRLPLIIPLIVAFFIYFIAGVAESNRSPFDLPEGESEIVGGYHTEYSGMRFGLFYLSEYGNMILISAITTTVFLGGYLGPALPVMKTVADTVGHFFYYFFWFAIKVWLMVTIMIWFRATFPRLRVDQLTDFAWKVLVPISFANLLIVAYIQFGDWDIRAIGETNWVLWYGNLSRLFLYPAVRVVILLVALTILSDILYPYRKAWWFTVRIGKFTRTWSKFILFEISFALGFLGFQVFRWFFIELDNSDVVEGYVQWVFYGISILLALWMIWDYIKARRAGVKFVSAADEEYEAPKNDLLDHQAIWE